MKIIFDYNRTIYNPDTDNLYQGVFDLLKKLALKHELYLVSHNDPARRNRLKELNISNLFQRSLFVGKKTKQIFDEISGFEKNTIVIGDSISNEIEIGNQLNLITIRVRQGRFSNEKPKNKNQVAKFEVTNISDLESIVLNYEK